VPPAHVYVGDHVQVSNEVNAAAALADTSLDEPPQVHRSLFRRLTEPETA
jgi:hypothetical protein